MTLPAVTFSDDQAEAFDSLSAMLRQSRDRFGRQPVDATSRQHVKRYGRDGQGGVGKNAAACASL